jgi:hypothetical protein
MALHVTYKPGKAQSEQAARYFQEAISALLDTMMQDMTEHTYRVDGRSGPSLKLRTWSREPLDDQQLHALFDRIVAVRSDVQRLEKGILTHGQVHHAISSWMEVAMEGEDLFVELTIVDPAEGTEEHPALSLGLVQGRSVLVSSDRLLFTWLDQDIFGLAIAGQGSYLFEVEEDRALRIAS